MATSSDRVVFIGTSDGVFVAQGNGGQYQAKPAGLQGMGIVRYLLADARVARRVYATTMKNGFWRSDDAGETWKEINNGILYREAWSLAQNPLTGTLYGGTGPASVFKSDDGGDTWTDCETMRNLPETIDWTFPNPPHVAHMKGLDAYGDRILGAVEEGWIVRSLDNGETWQDIKAGTHFDAHYVNTMPDNPDVVIHTAGEGIFKSVNGGESFVDAMDGLDHRYMSQIIVHPDRPQVLFTAAAEVPPPFWFKRPEGANSAVYRSDNQGESWQRLVGGLPEVMVPAPRAVAGDPGDRDTFYIGTFPKGSLWMTENGGDSFREVLDDIPPVNSLLVAHA